MRSVKHLGGPPNHAVRKLGREHASPYCENDICGSNTDGGTDSAHPDFVVKTFLTHKIFVYMKYSRGKTEILARSEYDTSIYRKWSSSMKCCSHRLILIFTALMIGGAIVAGDAFANPQAKLIIAGTGSSIGVMKRMAADFQQRHPDVTVSILPSIGSTGGIKAVTEGKIDIGLSSRSLKPKEGIPGIIEEAYGRTAFIFGVQESNPIEGLSLTEIEEIYARKRTAWSDGRPIRMILRPLSDSYSALLASINPGMKSAYQLAHSIPGVFVGITDRDAALQIEKTPGSFGTTSAAIVAAERLKIKALSVDGVSPTLPNVSSGNYPYAMTMSVVYKTDKYMGAVKDFIDFVFSNDGRQLLSANGHVTLPRMAGK